MTAYDLAKLRVLTVDDSQYMIKIIKALLEAMGITSVLGVNSAEEVFTALEEWQPDLIITDHLMDPIDGLELIKQIRRLESSRNRYIPIVLLTGNAKFDVVKDARHRVGADAVLVKPVSVARLHTCIVALYESSRNFIETTSYFGPDRRAQDRPFEGPNKRGARPPQDKTAPGQANPDDLVFIDDDEGQDDVTARTSGGNR